MTDRADCKHDDGPKILVTCPTCNGKGTIVKDGPHPDEYDNLYPCPQCCPRPLLKGSGFAWVDA